MTPRRRLFSPSWSGTIITGVACLIALVGCGSVPSTNSMVPSSLAATLTRAEKAAGFSVKLPSWLPPGGRLIGVQEFPGSPPGVLTHPPNLHDQILLFFGANGKAWWRIQLFEQGGSVTLGGPDVTTVEVDGLRLLEQPVVPPAREDTVAWNAPNGFSYIASAVHLPLSDLVRIVVSMGK